LSFEGAVLAKEGREGAFANVLARPPSSTAEILHPEIYMSKTPVPVLRLPDIHPLIAADWNPYDVGVLGEFDVQILAELFGGKEIADAVAPEWAGGVYYAAQKKSADTPELKNSTASLAILYESKWKNEDSARTFAHVYTGQLPRKYDHIARREKDEKDADEQVYTTNEGDVLISIEGTGVFISEGFPLELARKLRDNITAVQSDGPVRVATLNLQRFSDPGMDLTREMASAGVMRAALHTMARYTSEGR
jgi:hypothetical protein